MMQARPLTRFLLPLAVVASLGLACTDESPPTQQKKVRTEGLAKRRAKFVERFDADGDGLVEIAELPDGLKTRFETADENGDGTLSDDELRAVYQRRVRRRFAASDLNADGALDVAEVTPAVWRHIQVADANNDGKVTLAELREAIKQGLIRRKRR
jgi:hypothetical protein